MKRKVECSETCTCGTKTDYHNYHCPAYELPNMIAIPKGKETLSLAYLKKLRDELKGNEDYMIRMTIYLLIQAR